MSSKRPFSVRRDGENLISVVEWWLKSSRNKRSRSMDEMLLLAGSGESWNSLCRWINGRCRKGDPLLLTMVAKPEIWKLRLRHSLFFWSDEGQAQREENLRLGLRGKLKKKHGLVEEAARVLGIMSLGPKLGGYVEWEAHDLDTVCADLGILTVSGTGMEKETVVEDDALNEPDTVEEAGWEYESDYQLGEIKATFRIPDEAEILHTEKEDPLAEALRETMGLKEADSCHTCRFSNPCIDYGPELAERILVCSANMAVTFRVFSHQVCKFYAKRPGV